MQSLIILRKLKQTDIEFKTLTGNLKQVWYTLRASSTSIPVKSSDLTKCLDNRNTVLNNISYKNTIMTQVGGTRELNCRSSNQVWVLDRLVTSRSWARKFTLTLSLHPGLTVTENNCVKPACSEEFRGEVMVQWLVCPDSKSNGLGGSPSWGHCVLSLYHGCHRHQFSEFPDICMIKIKFPWPDK